MVLYGFAGYHIWLIKRNTTTNESYKWTDYVRYINFYRQKEALQKATLEEKKEKEKEKDQSSTTKTNNNTNNNNSTNNKNSNSNPQKETDDELKARRRMTSKAKKEGEGEGEEEEGEDIVLPPRPLYSLDEKGRIKVKNIYNKGFLSNMWEALNPPSYRSSLKGRPAPPIPSSIPSTSSVKQNEQQQTKRK